MTLDVDEYLIDIHQYVQKNYLLALKDIEDDMHFPATRLSESSMKGGKMLRPMLVMLSCQACGGDKKEAMDFAIALQLIHSASLVHDDVLDNDSVRRGLPAVHELMGIGAAILTGDASLAKALNMITKYGPQVTKLSSQTIYALTRGAVIEAIEFPKGAFDRSLYIDVIVGKTASLFSLCCQVGAISAYANPKQEEACRKYGKDLGILFQMVDDTVDVLDSVVNKKPVGDVAELKTTMPLYEVFMAEDAIKERFTKFKGKEIPFEDLLTIVKIDGSGFKRVKAEIIKYRQKAIMDAGDLAQSDFRTIMLALPDFVTEKMFEEKGLWDIWKKI